MSDIIIFDTTLRDGEQSPGASMNCAEKIRIAKALESLKVNVIEAGFAISSPDDFKSVNEIAKLVKNSTVCSLSRALDKDIDAAAEALKPAASKRIHTFIATSPIHMQHKLKMQPEAVLEAAVAAVKRARQYTDDVEFSAEDAGRSEPEFLYRIIEAVINAGATTINIPDTVGYTLPHQFGALIEALITNIPNSDKAIFSVHCHNDLGLAVANSLAAVLHGARQVEGTINGIGERAGNAALEEVIMALKTRKDEFKVNVDIDTKKIMTCSKLVSSITGFPVQPNKAIVGANAFAHEAGIHQDGVLKHRETYEIMRAEDVGWNAESLVLGKHSGRNAFKSRLAELGVEFANEDNLNQAFAKFKALADRKHEIYDEDLLALVSETAGIDLEPKLELLNLEVTSKAGGKAEAKVEIKLNGNQNSTTATGSGPVDATFKAIEAIVKSNANLQLYSVNAISKGEDAQGKALVRLKQNGHIANGQGADTDVVYASAKAYIDAVNMLLNYQKQAGAPI